MFITWRNAWLQITVGTNQAALILSYGLSVVGRCFQPLRKWQLQIWPRTSSLHTGGYRLQITIKWHWRLPSQSHVIRTGVSGSLWLTTIVFEMFHYSHLLFLFVYHTHSDSNTKTCEISMAGRDVRNYWVFFCSELQACKMAVVSNLSTSCLMVSLYWNCCWNIAQRWFFKSSMAINTLRPRQNGRHFPDNTFKRIFLNENVRILIKISLKFVPKGPINNIPALVQIMAWHRPGDKPLSEPMMVSLPTHICVTRPQWVKALQCLPIFHAA